MDSAAGMGFGTCLSPLLILIGYDLLQIVPTLLIAESISGLIDAYFDNEFDNVDLSFRPLSDDSKLALIIAFFGCISIFFSIFLSYSALKLPKVIIKLYIVFLVIFMGIFSLVKKKIKKKDDIKLNPKLLIGFSALAGFNKGIGGGGYGPVVTLGQVISGVYEKSATAIVSFSEALVSIVGIFTFFLISALGVNINLNLLPSVFTGSFIAALICPYIVRIIPNRIWKYIIPIYAIGVGIFLLIKILFSF